jgi:hypothetical protein
VLLHPLEDVNQEVAAFFCEGKELEKLTVKTSD